MTDADEPEEPDAPRTVGVVGYGEVGQALVARLRDRGLPVVVTNRSPDALRERLAGEGIAVAADPAAVAARSDLVLSAVWPETAPAVAEAAAPGLDGTLYVDLNSVAPGTAEAIAAVVCDAGGRFANASIVGSVPRLGADAPMVVGGPAHAAAADALSGFLTVEDLGADPGRPAALRMCRSVVTKGLMALFVEALLPALAYDRDLAEAVLDSVDRSFAETSLGEFARYYLVDMVENADRRAGELAEVRRTLREAGLRAPMVERTQWLNETLAEADAGGEDYATVLEALRPYFEERC